MQFDIIGIRSGSRYEILQNRPNLTEQRQLELQPNSSVTVNYFHRFSPSYLARHYATSGQTGLRIVWQFTAQTGPWPYFAEEERNVQVGHAWSPVVLVITAL